MSNGISRVMKPIRRRRMFIYLIGIIISLGMVASTVMAVMIYGFVEQALFSALAGVFLVLAAVMFLYLQFAELRRAEKIVKLAIEHNGLMRMEWLTKELQLPERKARSLMFYFEKRKLAVVRKEGERWTFPDLQVKETK